MISREVQDLIDGMNGDVTINFGWSPAARMAALIARKAHSIGSAAIKAPGALGYTAKSVGTQAVGAAKRTLQTGIRGAKLGATSPGMVKPIAAGSAMTTPGRAAFKIGAKVGQVGKALQPTAQAVGAEFQAIGAKTGQALQSAKTTAGHAFTNVRRGIITPGQGQARLAQAKGLRAEGRVRRNVAQILRS